MTNKMLSVRRVNEQGDLIWTFTDVKDCQFNASARSLWIHHHDGTDEHLQWGVDSMVHFGDASVPTQP